MRMEGEKKIRHIQMITLVAIPLTPILEVIEMYVFGDWEFVKFLVVAMTVDTLLGFMKHVKRKDVSSKAWGMIARKVMLYAAVLILTHVLCSFKIANEVVGAFLWFRYFACSALMVREAISIIENIEEIYPGFFPGWVVKKLSGFNDETGVKE